MRLRSLAPAVLTAAAVLVLPACGGDSDESSAASSGSSSSSSSAAATSESPAGDADTAAFCSQAQAALDANNQAVLTAQEDPTQLSAAVQQATDQLDAITPPDEIAADWQTLVDTGQQLADLTAGVDITTPEGQAQIAGQLQEIGAAADPASANVEAYLTDTCGIATTPTS